MLSPVPNSWLTLGTVLSLYQGIAVLTNQDDQPGSLCPEPFHQIDLRGVNIWGLLSTYFTVWMFNNVDFRTSYSSKTLTLHSVKNKTAVNPCPHFVNFGFLLFSWVKGCLLSTDGSKWDCYLTSSWRFRCWPPLFPVLWTKCSLHCNTSAPGWVVARMSCRCQRVLWWGCSGQREHKPVDRLDRVSARNIHRANSRYCVRICGSKFLSQSKYLVLFSPTTPN